VIAELWSKNLLRAQASGHELSAIEFARQFADKNFLGK
jgi:hypothetical protein